MVYNGFSMRWSLLVLLAGCATSGGQPPSAVPVKKDAVSINDYRLATADQILTPAFAAIDSYDVSLERREVVFSAKRDKSFDVGIVSLDGSDIHWVPEDPADEVGVKWAGNKISYIIHRAGGDLVRTVHVPTAMQQAADFPYATVKSMTWDPSGERYSVVLTSPDASEQTVSLKFDGGGRQTTSPPKVKLDVNVEPFAGGVLLRPSLLRYNERLPLVVWRSDKPLEWNGERGALMKENRIAVAVVAQLPATLPNEPWLDASRVFYVCDRAGDARCRDLESIRQDLNGRR